MKLFLPRALLVLVLALSGGPIAAAESSGEEPSEPQKPEGELTAVEIYERVLGNRFNGFIQDLVMVSGGREEKDISTKVEFKYKNYRGEKPRIVSKTMLKYDAPQDVRHRGYLIVSKTKGKDDEFIYRPESRRVRRHDLRGEAIFGTDFSFEEIIPQEFDDGTYVRLPDEDVGNVACFVIEVTPTEKADSEYSKFNVYIHKKNYVPIRTDFFDDADIHIKRLASDPDSIEEYQDEKAKGPKKVWVATRQKITQLKQDTWTRLTIENLKSKPKLRDKDFSERKLADSH